MLCYHSSRKISNVTREALSWLALNHRAFKMLLWPIVLISFVATLVMYDHFNQLIYADRIKFLAPFTFVAATDGSMLEIVLYGAMAALSTLLIVPLLRRYFVDRRGLQHIKPKTMADTYVKNLKWALFAAVTMGVGFYFMAMSSNVFPSILMGIVVTWLVPITYMPGGGRKWDGRNLFAILGGWIFMFMMYYVLIKLPYLMFGLIIIGMELLDEILPGIFADSDEFLDIACMIFTTLSCIAYCIAIIVLNVNALLLHGTIYTKE